MMAEECPICDMVDEFCQYTGKPEECRTLVKAMMEGKITPTEARRKLEELVSPEKLREISEKLSLKLSGGTSTQT